MRQLYVILPILVAMFVLLALLALCSREDAPPGQVAPDEAIHLK
jgi:hypothetical protein